MKPNPDISEILNRPLPKWPGLLVVGEPVTEFQAMLIIIRTDHFSFISNDREFQKQINRILYDIECSSDNLDEEIIKKYQLSDGLGGYSKVNEIRNGFIERYLPINLYYLNNSRITSAWIGGPRGWCDWDGTIHSSNSNIGKYPEISEVYSDCEVIAENFKFLKMKVQLLDRETCEEDQSPVVEFHISDGKVTVHDPIELLTQPTDVPFNFDMHVSDGRERGCTIEKFKEALDAVLKMNQFEKNPEGMLKKLKI
jgi:hypothetical protein